MKKQLYREWRQFVLLVQQVPPLLLCIFALNVFAMNLLANKSISLSVSWLALDCGTLISWIAFLCMDVLVKRFGPKAGIQISLLTTTINLAMCLLFWCISLVDGVWSHGGTSEAINGALDATFGGTWYVVLGSTGAFLLASVVNALVNHGVGKLFVKNPNSYVAFACRTYVATAVGQFVDNLTFTFAVSYVFFDWTITQCFVCATTCMAVELLFQIAFTRVGYKICKNWQKRGVGEEYLKMLTENVA